MKLDLRAPIPVVIVGFGRMGRLHARTLACLPEFALHAVVDTDASLAPLAADLGLAFHTSLDDVAPAANFAIVAVPSSAHAQVFDTVAARGMDCLIEKPVGTHLAELEAMAARAKTCGVHVFAGYSERFNPIMHGVAEAVRSAPCAVTIRRLSSIALERAVDHDVMYDLLAHDLDWVMRTLGASPQSVAVEAQKFHAGRLEEIECRLRFARGVHVHLTASRIAAASERSVAVAGADGQHALFHLDAWREMAVEDALTRQAKALAAALHGRHSSIARIEDALRVQSLLALLDAELTPRDAERGITTSPANAG